MNLFKLSSVTFHPVSVMVYEKVDRMFKSVHILTENSLGRSENALFTIGMTFVNIWSNESEVHL